MSKQAKGANGFSMLEMLIAALVFTVVAGSIFSILLSSQLRYQSDSGLTTAFQQANLVIDQITRDVHSAGYPPASAFGIASGACAASQAKIAMAFAWSPNYSTVWPCNNPPVPAAPCLVDSTCTIPGPNDLIVEAAASDGTVQWIRYSLTGTTLLRIAVAKAPAADAASATDPNTVQAAPYLENVMNASDSTPVFTYVPDPSVGLAPPYPPYPPSRIRIVNISLKVQSAKPDSQTGQFRKVTLTGQAVRFNPN